MDQKFLFTSGPAFFFFSLRKGRKKGKSVFFSSNNPPCVKSPRSDFALILLNFTKKGKTDTRSPAFMLLPRLFSCASRAEKLFVQEGKKKTPGIRASEFLSRHSTAIFRLDALAIMETKGFLLLWLCVKK